MLSSEEDCPGDAAGVLALEEEGFGFAVLEAEDLAVAADVELALFCDVVSIPIPFIISALLTLHREVVAQKCVAMAV